jgi:hypothetical protein
MISPAAVLLASIHRKDAKDTKGDPRNGRSEPISLLHRLIGAEAVLLIEVTAKDAMAHP